MVVKAFQLQIVVKVLQTNLIDHMVVKVFQLQIVVEVLQITKRAKQTIEGYNMASLHL